MSEFRERVAGAVVHSAGHPQRAYDVLDTLESAMREKIQRDEVVVHPEFRNGLAEMWALISNLRGDIAHEYGIEEG